MGGMNGMGGMGGMNAMGMNGMGTNGTMTHNYFPTWRTNAVVQQVKIGVLDGWTLYNCE